MAQASRPTSSTGAGAGLTARPQGAHHPLVGQARQGVSERAALAELRTYSSRQRDAEWVATGEPTCCYCAICECPKSGDAEVPNQHAECCRDDICACHTPEEEAA